MQKHMRQRTTGSLLAAVFSIILACGALPVTAYATEGKTEVAGTVYEFEKGSHYEISDADSEASAQADETNTYGNFALSGSIVNISTKNGVPAYEVSENDLKLFYTYSDTLLNAEEDTWHLVDDKSKKIDDMELDSDIMKGAILLQTSKDRKNWIDVSCTTNAFSDVPAQTASFYSASEIQLNNGCFYRLIVVYETRIKEAPTQILFVQLDNYSYKKHAEVYEFYACNSEAATKSDNTDQDYYLGKTVRCDKFDGYYGEASIDKDDPHYNWKLGDFFVNGYTETTEDDDGNVVFLKNVGDKVTLWFNLAQSIDDIKGDGKVSVTADEDGYDQYFQTEAMDFGRGTLIIRYTDYNNAQGDPIIYTNYLEAAASVGADTKVQLFEEGDYEVALDYEVTKDQLIDTIGHYRIFFKFSVRNGNCMVYPFDVETGSELSNSSMTENGFRLDLAKSRYLKINLRREVLKDSADGLMEDTRFNGPAKDGAEYTDEGIYTITVTNEYTNQTTTKKIYVGTNSILKAYMTTGLSISEINALVDEGATISEDGTIQLTAQSPAETVEPDTSDGEQEENPSESTSEKDTEPDASASNTEAEPSQSSSDIESETPSTGEEKESNTGVAVLIGVLVAAAAAGAVFVIVRKKKLTDTFKDKGGTAK